VLLALCQVWTVAAKVGGAKEEQQPPVKGGTLAAAAAGTNPKELIAADSCGGLWPITASHGLIGCKRLPPCSHKDNPRREGPKKARRVSLASAQSARGICRRHLGNRTDPGRQRLQRSRGRRRDSMWFFLLLFLFFWLLLFVTVLAVVKKSRSQRESRRMKRRKKIGEEQVVLAKGVLLAYSFVMQCTSTKVPY
jgi:hypothetical protein